MADWEKKETVVITAPGKGRASRSKGADKPPAEAEAAAEVAGTETEVDPTDGRGDVLPGEVWDAAGEETVYDGEVLDSDKAASVREPAHQLRKDPPAGYMKVRRRKRRAAPLIGFTVLLLAVVGIAALVVSGVNIFIRSTDDTELINELTVFLKPVLRQQPKAFADISAADSSQMLEASLWYLTNKERIRMDQNKTTISSYAYDDFERWKIPVREVEASYKRLFGPDAVLEHHSIGEKDSTFSVEYNQSELMYHAPLSAPMLMYEAVPDTLKKKDGLYTLRICYVLSANIEINDEGELIDPTPDMAEFAQLFTLKRTGDGNGWILVSIADENGGMSAAASQTTEETSEESTQNLVAAYRRLYSPGRLV